MSHTDNKSGGFQLDSQSTSWLNWPVIGGNVTVITFFHDLWAAAPGATAVYTVVTTVFMLFQMFDKLGLLDGLKRKRKDGAGE